jgi:hypothetical protein
MTVINDAYINALLADAAYVKDLAAGNLASDLSSRMTPTLAKYIADNFTVVTQIDSNDLTGSGFDATVWRGKTGTDFAGRTFVSMRGTEGLADIDADVDLTVFGVAQSQYIDMVNWWLRATTPSNAFAQQIAAGSLLTSGGLFKAAGGMRVRSQVLNARGWIFDPSWSPPRPRVHHPDALLQPRPRRAALSSLYRSCARRRIGALLI